jgi:hypothetical protein
VRHRHPLPTLQFLYVTWPCYLPCRLRLTRYTNKMSTFSYLSLVSFRWRLFSDRWYVCFASCRDLSLHLTAYLFLCSNRAFSKCRTRLLEEISATLTFTLCVFYLEIVCGPVICELLFLPCVLCVCLCCGVQPLPIVSVLLPPSTHAMLFPIGIVFLNSWYSMKWVDVSTTSRSRSLT